MSHKDNTFEHIDLDDAFGLVFGWKGGVAGCYEEPKFRKNQMRKWIKKVKSRTIDLTNNDERMRSNVLKTLDSLNSRLNDYPRKKSEWNIIAQLIEIIGYLLGYERYVKSIRNQEFHTIVFLQNIEQERATEQILKRTEVIKRDRSYKFFDNTRQEICLKLKEDGLTNYEIGLILNIKGSKVSRILKQ